VFTNALKPPYQMKMKPAVPGFPQQCHALDDSSPGLPLLDTVFENHLSELGR